MERDGCAGAVLLPTDIMCCWDLGLKIEASASDTAPWSPHAYSGTEVSTVEGRGPSAAFWGCHRAGTLRAVVVSDPQGQWAAATLLWHYARAAATFCCTHFWLPVVRSHTAFVTRMWV